MTDQPPPQMTEAELRAAYEAQMEEQLRRLRVEDVVVQTIVTLINLGGRRAGLAPGTEDERDPAQLRLAVDGARALLGLVEGELGPDAAAIKDALSQLQLAYARLAVQDPAGTPASQPPSAADPNAGRAGPGPGPAQSSGRLWVPGQ